MIRKEQEAWAAVALGRIVRRMENGMAIEDLKDLYVHTLQDIYYAEKQILKALPKMASKAGNAQLKKAFEDHRKETEEHVKRLEQVFKLLDEKPKGEECPAIDGIIEEAQELIGEIKDAETRDAGMLAAAQAVEHYEMTRYGTLVSWGEELGITEASTILQKTLDEEKAADAKLTKIGEGRVNKKAA